MNDKESENLNNYYNPARRYLSTIPIDIDKAKSLIIQNPEVVSIN